MIPVLLEHSRVIGLVLDVDLDNIGIKFTLGVWEDVFQDNLSIGFKALEYVKYSHKRIIESFCLKEVSLVQFPAQRGTKCQKL